LRDELSGLERELERLEEALMAKSAEYRHNGTFRRDVAERCQIADRIEKKLRAYNELIMQHSELRKRPSVAKKDRNNITNWSWNHENAITVEETEYIQHSDDLFAISPTSKTPVRRFLELSRHFRLFWL
jgi:chromatin segregation and condensation protein Rec8/ScpA/Scc1 (kleisin family)